MLTKCQVTFPNQSADHHRRMLLFCRKLRRQPVLQAQTGLVGVIVDVYQELDQLVYIHCEYPDHDRQDEFLTGNKLP